MIRQTRRYNHYQPDKSLPGNPCSRCVKHSEWGCCIVHCPDCRKYCAGKDGLPPSGVCTVLRDAAVGKAAMS